MKDLEEAVEKLRNELESLKSEIDRLLAKKEALHGEKAGPSWLRGVIDGGKVN